MENKRLRRQLKRMAGSACFLMLAGVTFTSCDDDLLTGTPEWLGSSIYAELQERGNFTEMLKLINDEVLASGDYPRTLNQTGSKTLFVADDDAWERFYEKNPWGVKKMSDMSPAQKKLLFKSSMINNAYLLELMSNTPGNPPTKGNCMRRSSSISYFDSIPLILPQDMPTSAYWDEVRNREKGILLMQDETEAPMIHFLPKFMKYNGITAEDYYILTNKEVNDVSRSYINGKKVVTENITCQNGYIHVLEEVPTPLQNMDGIIASKNQFSMFAKMLSRYTIPVYDPQITAEYKELTGSDDSVFVKRYFNNSLLRPYKTASDGTSVTTLLRFDPGWNRFVIDNQEGITMAQDAGAMLVPTDKALIAYFDGEGKALKDRFKTWDDVPDDVLAPLISNMMLQSFRSSVPSRFGSVTNKENENMGLTIQDVDSCFIGCNGVVYQVNRVFTAPEYQSVYFPVLIRNNEFSVIYTAINSENSSNSTMKKSAHFKSYLNSMGSKYSFIVPSDKAIVNYIDPVSYAKKQPKLLSFELDPVDKSIVKATAYAYDMETGEVGAELPRAQQPTTEEVVNRLIDIIDNHIIIGTVQDGQTHYRNKAGGPIVINKVGDDYQMAGSYQVEKGTVVEVDSVYDMSNGGNGVTYILEDSPLMTTTKSPIGVIKETPEFQSFYSLLEGCEFIKNLVDNKSTIDQAISFFNNFHYTIYVPSNESIDELINGKKLYTWADYEAVQDNEELDMDKKDSLLAVIRMQIEDFVRYHIQDNALYLGGQSVNGEYESACLDTTINRFRKLQVNYTTGGEMLITDGLNNKRYVQNSTSNKLSRQYLFNATTVEASKTIYSSSYAVIHHIDEPLYYSEEQYAVNKDNENIIRP